MTMRQFYPAFLAASLFVLAGCEAAGLTLLGSGSGVAMGTGIQHSLGGIVYKTFTAPSDRVWLAAHRGLERMEIAVVDESEEEGNWTINAKASERDITVELEELTPRTTRMRVVAEDGILFKDSATATEIIVQTATALDELDANMDVAGR